MLDSPAVVASVYFFASLCFFFPMWYPPAFVEKRLHPLRYSNDYLQTTSCCRRFVLMHVKPWPQRHCSVQSSLIQERLSVNWRRKGTSLEWHTPSPPPGVAMVAANLAHDEPVHATLQTSKQSPLTPHAKVCVQRFSLSWVFGSSTLYQIHKFSTQRVQPDDQTHSLGCIYFTLF